MPSSVPNRAPADRRGAPRYPCFLDAVVLPGRQPCIVVDRSDTGFKLSFHRPHHGQTSLVVVLMASGEAYGCEVQWNRGCDVGVLITAQCDLKGLAPGAFAEARHLWNRLKTATVQRPVGGQGSNDP